MRCAHNVLAHRPFLALLLSLFFKMHPGNSLVGRATSFTNYGLMDLNEAMYTKYSNMEPDALVDEVGSAGSDIWNKACHASWEGAKEAVNVICKRMSMSERDLLDLSLILWVSTFYHGFIGDFQLDSVNKGNLLFTLANIDAKADLGYLTLATTIGVTTMTRTMNMMTLETYLPRDDERTAWAKYRKVLKEVDTGVKDFSTVPPIYTGVNF
jgi:hypothetical protein